MQKIAIIGYGNHVKKNILPAISRMSEVEVDAIYVRDLTRYQEEAEAAGVTLRSLDESIGGEVEWVYVATPITTHYDLASRFLRMGKHVICEKPLTENYEKSLKLLEIAETSGRRLFEVCMYQYHKQFEHLRALVESKKGELKTFSTAFAIPHLNTDNIRYNKELGGGALLDVGYYPVSLILSLFGEPKAIQTEKFTDAGYEVDLRGIAIFRYDGFYAIAEWGIGLPYRNEATLTSDTEAYVYERIFSKPPTLETSVKVSSQSGIVATAIGMDDPFVNLFQSCFSALEQNDKAAIRSVNLHTLKALSEIARG